MTKEEAKAIIEAAVEEARAKIGWGTGLYSWDGPANAQTPKQFMAEACIVFGQERYGPRSTAAYIGAAGWLHKAGFPQVKESAAELAAGDYEQALHNHPVAVLQRKADKLDSSPWWKS
jgi:hypothetical protein